MQDLEYLRLILLAHLMPMHDREWMYAILDFSKGRPGRGFIWGRDLDGSWWCPHWAVQPAWCAT